MVWVVPATLSLFATISFFFGYRAFKLRHHQWQTHTEQPSPVGQENTDTRVPTPVGLSNSLDRQPSLPLSVEEEETSFHVGSETSFHLPRKPGDPSVPPMSGEISDSGEGPMGLYFSPVPTPLQVNTTAAFPTQPYLEV